MSVSSFEARSGAAFERAGDGPSDAASIGPAPAAGRGAQSRAPAELRHEDLAGLWRRDLLRRVGHADDRTTEVWWFQGRRLYADLRVPSTLVEIGPDRALAEAPVLLLVQEAFAGVIDTTTGADGLRCTWTRTLDWAAWSETPDVGRLAWDSRCDPEAPGRRMLEDGVGGDYHEVWRREATLGPGDFALRLVDDRQRRAFLVRIGERFLFVRGRAREHTARLLLGAPPLDDAAGLAAVVAMEASFGHIGARGWRILVSAQPRRPLDHLCDALDPTGETVRLSERAADGALIETLWRIEERELF